MRSSVASRRACGACLLLAVAAVLARPAVAQATSTKQFFNIPRQPAADAIRKLTELTNFQILYPPALLRGLESSPVSGTMAPREALARLLGATSIDIVDIVPGTATLRLHQPANKSENKPQYVPAIVVTARRFSELITEVPIAITVVSGKSIERNGTQSVIQTLLYVPGVSAYDAGSGLTKISIRGVSTSLGGNENGYYLDDLPFSGVSVPITPDIRAWDLERIEVLRGPQGTLFGEGSMGGTIRILTNNAQLDRFSAAAQTGLSQTEGGSSGRSAKAMINIPVIGNMMAVRVAATDETLPGWLDDPPSGRRDINPERLRTVRLRALFQPIERLRINASYWRYDGSHRSGVNASDAGFAPQAGPLLDASSGYAVKGISAAYDFDKVNVFYGYASNRYKLPLSGVFTGAAFRSDIEIGVATHDLRLSSNSRKPLRWTGGIYWRNAERGDTFIYPSEDIDQQSATSSRTASFYGDLTYTLPSLPLEAGFGLRHFRDHLVGRDSNHGIETRSDDAVFSSNNPKLSLSYRPRDDYQIYASASKGFRSGQRQVTGFDRIASTTGVSFPSVISPDTIWTYELGTKLSILDQRLNMEFAAYHNDWKNVAVRFPLGTTGLNALVNSPGTKTNGFDAALSYALTSSLKAGMTASVVDACYTGSVTGTDIRSGAAVDDVPRFLASANVELAVPYFAAWKTIVRAALQHASPHRSAVFPSYSAGDTINNANARISFNKRPWTFAIYGENLLNDRGAASVRSTATLTSTANETYSPRLRPRTIGVELSFAID